MSCCCCTFILFRTVALSKVLNLLLPQQHTGGTLYQDSKGRVNGWYGNVIQSKSLVIFNTGDVTCIYIEKKTQLLFILLCYSSNKLSEGNYK